MLQDYQSVLVLAPHTDDGELGCGGTIARLVEMGKRVHYVAYSTCRRSLPDGWPEDTLELELRSATAILGIPQENVIARDFDVRTFKENRQPILEDMILLRKQINPDLVFVPSPMDIHQDHQVISEEGLRAFKNSTIMGYEMPWNNASFNTRGFVKLSEENIVKKVNALGAYKSQLHRNYVNENFIRSLATVRGVQIGVEFAEAFEIIRIIM